MTTAVVQKLRPPVMGSDEEFVKSKAMEELGMMLCARHGLAAGQYQIAYLWKRKGGKSKGKPKLGQAQLTTTGLLSFFADYDAVVWLAADNLAEYDSGQIEAVLYHELLHIGSDEETLDIKLVPHDFEGFVSELAVYGAYDHDLMQMRDAVFTQAELRL